MWGRRLTIFTFNVTFDFIYIYIYAQYTVVMSVLLFDMISGLWDANTVTPGFHVCLQCLLPCYCGCSSGSVDRPRIGSGWKTCLLRLARTFKVSTCGDV